MDDAVRQSLPQPPHDRGTNTPQASQIPSGAGGFGSISSPAVGWDGFARATSPALATILKPLFRGDVCVSLAYRVRSAFYLRPGTAATPTVATLLQQPEDLKGYHLHIHNSPCGDNEVVSATEREEGRGSRDQTLIAPTERLRRSVWLWFWGIVVGIAVVAAVLGAVSVFWDPFPGFLAGVPPEQKSAWYVGILVGVEALLLVLERGYSKAMEGREWFHHALRPSYEAKDSPRPSDAEVANMYSEVLGNHDFPRFLREVPVLLFLPPGKYDTDEIVSASGGPFDKRELRRVALRFGVNYDDFSEWLVADSRKRYGRRVNRAMVRLTSLPETHLRSDGRNVISLKVGRCRYEDFLMTDYATLWKIEPQEASMRDLLETRTDGDGWIAPTDFVESAKRFSMMIGVTVLITAFQQGTQEPVLILQRRSGRVKEGKGGVGASASGGMEWRRDRIMPPSLGPYDPRTWILGAKSLSVMKAALNETYEELGLRPRDLRGGGVMAPAIIGAGYNLLHGRDLNFYLHFHSTLSFEEILRCSRDARDRWEMQHLVPVRLRDLVAAWQGGSSSRVAAALASDGNRHLLAALTCFFAGGRADRFHLTVPSTPAERQSEQAEGRTGAQAKRLVLVMGAPGTGKSDVSRHLCELLGAAHLDKDLINEAFVSCDRESSFYEVHIRDQSYEAVYKLAKENLSHGVSVILDAPFLGPVKDEKWRKRIEGIATETSSKLEIVQVLLSEETLRERLRKRNEPRDRQRLEDDRVWREWIEKEPPSREITWPNQSVIAFWNDGELSRAKVQSQIAEKLHDS